MVQLIKLITILEQYNVPFVTLFDRLYGAGDKVEKIHDAMIRDKTIKEKQERAWRRQMNKDHMTFVREFPDKEFVRDAKRRRKIARQQKLYARYKKTTDPREAYFLEQQIAALANDNNITQDMVVSAKQYPLENIIEVNRSFFAQCVAHEDTHPSMYCKNNFAHCFTCGYSGDVIDIYMRVHDVGFAEAVNNLQ